VFWLHRDINFVVVENCRNRKIRLSPLCCLVSTDSENRTVTLVVCAARLPRSDQLTQVCILSQAEDGLGCSPERPLFVESVIVDLAKRAAASGNSEIRSVL
jgi:hypothetical protein